MCFTEKHIYVQFIDDAKGCTLAAASTLDRGFRDGGQHANAVGAAALGRLAAEKALAASIKQVVFDRGGFKYHGRVKALAEALREKGIEF